MPKLTPKPKKKLVSIATAKKVASEIKNRASRTAPSSSGGSSTRRGGPKPKKG